MAIIGNNADSFFRGLSDFWTRFFADTEVLKDVYDGNTVLIGQHYLNLLYDVFNTSVDDIKLFRREYYKLITIREDQLKYYDTGDPPANRFRYVDDENNYFVRVQQLQNKVLEPTAQLENVLDYDVRDGQLLFKVNPVNVSEYAAVGGPDPQEGYALRHVEIPIEGIFKSATIGDFYVNGARNGDTLLANEYVDITYVYQIDNIDLVALGVVIGDKIYLNSRTTTVASVINEVTVETASEHLIAGTMADTSVVIKDATDTITKFSGVRTVRLDLNTKTIEIALAQPGQLVLRENGGLVENKLYYWKVHRVLTNGDPQTILPSSTGTCGTFEESNSINVLEIGAWTTNIEIDQHDLYKRLGYLLGDKQKSTELYRSFIKGLLQLYSLGPTIDRLESALNVVAGLPVIRDDGEVLLEYQSGEDAAGFDGQVVALTSTFISATANFVAADTGGILTITDLSNPGNHGDFVVETVVDGQTLILRHKFPMSDTTGRTWTFSRGGIQYVKTSRALYKYPLHIPFRDEITYPPNFGVYTFRAFEFVTTAIQVTDYIESPTWWHDTPIPYEIWPEDIARRQVSQDLFPVVIGGGGTALAVGDPGFYIGGDENNVQTAAPFRHSTAYLLMHTVLKYNIFRVRIDAGIEVNNLLISDIAALVREVKLPHTFFYYAPESQFEDLLTVTDTIGGRYRLLFKERIDNVPNEAIIDGSWSIGDAWRYPFVSGDVIALGVGPTFIPICIGGSNPHIVLTPGTQQIISRAVHAYAHV